MTCRVQACPKCKQMAQALRDCELAMVALGAQLTPAALKHISISVLQDYEEAEDRARELAGGDT